MSKPPKSKQIAFTSLPRLLLIVVLAASVAASLYVAQQRWTNRYWQQRLATVSDEESPALVKQISASGDGGICVLAAGLGSPRETVRREVRLALDDELNRWARLPRAQASAKLGALVAALADEAEHFEPTSRLFAADMVTRILLWPTDETVIERSQIVADCERVLRLANLQAEQASSRWQRRSDAVRSAQVAADLRPLSLPAVIRNPLRMEELAPPALPPMLTGLEQRSAEPTLLATDDSPRRLTAGQAAARRIASPSKVAQAAANQAAYVTNDVEQASSSRSADDSRSASPGNLREQEATALFAMLSQSGAAAAETELTRRGFRPREIEAGKHLTSSDPDERRRWTESLPGMRGIDAKNWLLWLSRDPDAAVRSAAVTLMATSQDPQMLRRVEAVSRDDSDPEVRAQAARIIAANSASSRP